MEIPVRHFWSKDSPSPRLKRSSLVTTAVAITLSLGIGVGQTVPSIPPEPELVAVFYYLDPASQELKKVTVESWRAHGYSEGSIDVPGTGSPFRVANDRPEFIFQVTHPERAKLFRLTVTVKSRHLRFEPVKANNGSKDSDPGIPVIISKFGNSSFKLTPQAPLEAGEYVLFIGEATLHSQNPDRPRLFTFAVGTP